jgi:hypothetical protein
MKGKIPKSAITEKQLRQLLEQDAKEHGGSISAWAAENGITPQAVSAFMRRVQSAGLQIPEALGYRPQTIFIPLKEELICHMNPPRKPAKRPSKKVDHTQDPIEKRGLKGRKNDRKETKKRLKKRNKK